MLSRSQKILGMVGAKFGHTNKYSRVSLCMAETLDLEKLKTKTNAVMMLLHK
ncbi:hypothetical protein HW555_013852 [Spodoptera exigua]|uniref:Uncharacterized protein n=1 Tax=Spodoptera exigua TaxID=7107 RepID=A0A835L236_SPOEX|nr:hypothetical protein HW555_013852 [Spodoptera exigua]